MPGIIQWTAVDSGFGAPGSSVVWRIEPVEGGGSTHNIVWDRRGRTVFGKVFIGLMGLTRGHFIRQSLEMGLAAIAARETRERALASIGGFRSDRSDVSERHDELLAEALDE